MAGPWASGLDFFKPTDFFKPDISPVHPIVMAGKYFNGLSVSCSDL